MTDPETEPVRDSVTDPVAAPLTDVRTSYEAGSLREADLAATPLEQFTRWFAQAREAGLAGTAEPSAMVVSTAGADGVPTSRTLLLKSVDAQGFVFFTNLASTKGRALRENPVASLLFPWHPMQRQVIVVGDVEEVSRDDAAAYFVTRPYGSRLGAWASAQSSVLASRDVLKARYAELAAAFPDTGSADDVPLPDQWGGFLVRPRSVEFWQGRPSRLHDRLRFARTSEPALLDAATDWRVERLSP